MKKEESDKIYKELRKEYTDKEIAESCIFSVDMSEKELEELKQYLKTNRRTLTKEEREQVKEFVERTKGC